MESLITVYLPVGVGTFHMETAADQFTRSVRLLKSIDGDVSLEDSSAYETTFVMGKENVHLAASYEEQKHHLSVIGGEGSGDYRFGETVTITADPAQEGFVFSRWYTEESYFLVADNETVSFDMPDRDIVIAACYNKEKKTN